jgi:hypothetical protein
VAARAAEKAAAAPPQPIAGSRDDVLRWRTREGDSITPLPDGTFKINGSTIQDLPTLLRRTNNLREAAKLPPFSLPGA